MPLDNAALDQLFRAARSHNAWQDKPVPDSLLHELHELMKWGPTSANCWPLRVVYVKSPEAKARLVPLLMEGNRAKVQAAPVTAILGMDLAAVPDDFDGCLLRQLRGHRQILSGFSGTTRTPTRR